MTEKEQKALAMLRGRRLRPVLWLPSLKRAEKPRRDAIATALASTPSGQCAVGVIDPEGDFLCAVTAP